MDKKNKLEIFIEDVLFRCKWVLVVPYIILAIVLVKMILKYIWYGALTTDDIMYMLEAVDITMVFNFLKSIITGSYNSFVSKNHGRKGENVSSGTLKVKMSTSLVSISSVLLLKVFLSVNTTTEWQVLWKLLVIHGAFLVTTLVLAMVELLHEKSEWYEHNTEQDEEEEEGDIIVMHNSPKRGA